MEDALDEREVLECPVCFDLFNNCCETSCGHAFCEYCLNRCLERELVCPVCRKDPTPIHPSFTVRRIVDKYRKIKGLHKEQVRPTNVNEEKEIGNSLYQQAQYAEAIRHYSEAINSTPGAASAVLYANRAACYFKLKQYLLAIEDCDRAIQIESNYVKAHVRKAACLENMKQFEKAVQVYKEAQRYDSRNQFKDEIEEGIKRLNRIIASTQDPPAPPPRAHNNPPPPQQQARTQFYNHPAYTNPYSYQPNFAYPPSQQQQQQQQQQHPSEIFQQFFGQNYPYPPPPPQYNNYQHPPPQQPASQPQPTRNYPGNSSSSNQNRNSTSNGSPSSNGDRSSRERRRQRRSSGACSQQ